MPLFVRPKVVCIQIEKIQLRSPMGWGLRGSRDTGAHQTNPTESLKSNNAKLKMPDMKFSDLPNTILSRHTHSSTNLVPTISNQKKKNVNNDNNGKMYPWRNRCRRVLIGIQLLLGLFRHGGGFGIRIFNKTTLFSFIFVTISISAETSKPTKTPAGDLFLGAQETEVLTSNVKQMNSLPEIVSDWTRTEPEGSSAETAAGESSHWDELQN